MINYYLITKPGIILGNLITVAAGFLLASKGSIDFQLLIATLLGLALIIASACIFNNYIDRYTDKKMDRTKNRPLAKGTIKSQYALIFATVLAILGNILLLIYTNLLTLFIANIGFAVYVLLYSLWKSRTIYGTAIGSISGGIPPLVGYCAVSNSFDVGAIILFLIMIFWQMPHFFSIAIYRIHDYTKAAIPVLPVEKGVAKTKRHMIYYILAFIGTTAALTLFNYTGYIYLVIATLLGTIWLLLCLQGFKAKNDVTWARNMFRFSLVTIIGICFIIPFDVLKT